MATRNSSDKVWRELRALVKNVDHVRVHVGIIGTEGASIHAGSTLTNIQIGLIHEFGSPRAGIPERSFIRSTFRVRRDELVRLQTSAARGILARRYTVEQALGLIGTWAAGAMRETIVKYGPFMMAPLAASTIRRKGSSAPLVDTGQLVNSISFVVFSV